MPKKTWVLALNEERGEVMMLGIGKTWEPIVGSKLPASLLKMSARSIDGFRVAKILNDKASAFAEIVRGEWFILDDFNHQGAEEYCKAIQELDEKCIKCKTEDKSFFDD